MKKILAIAAASFFVVGVHADQGKAYFGGEFGVAKLEDYTGQLASGLVSAVGGAATATQDSSISTFKVLGGYKYTENFDLEAGYFQSGTANLRFNGVSRNAVAYLGNATMKLSGFEYAANVRPSIASGWNNLYLRVGGHNSKLETSVSVTANAVSASSSKTYSGSGTLYGLGYDQKLNETTNIRYSAVKYNKIGGESDTGGTFYSIGLVKNF